MPETDIDFDLDFDLDTEGGDSGGEDGIDAAEASKGYMRQSDYTKKTQEIALLREEARSALALKDFIDRNPKVAAAQLMSSVLGQDDDEDVDPIEGLKRELEALKAASRDQANVAQFQSAVTAAIKEQAKAGVDMGDLTIDEVAEYMNEEGISNPKTAVKHLARERKEASSSTRRQEVTDSKRSIGVVGASSAKGESTPQRPTTIREAYEMAKKGIRVE